MKLSNIDIRHLRVFLAVVECGGFSAAEGLLGISQSTISTHIAELERRLGYQICKRGRPGFMVTERGRELHASTLKLVEAFTEFEDKAHTLRGAVAGRLRVALIDNLITDPHCPVTKALASLSVFRPGPRITIDILPPAEIEMAVASGRVDAGISIMEKRLPSLRYSFLYAERDILVCARDHPLFEHQDEAVLRRGAATMPKVVRSFLNHHDFFLISDQEESITATVTSIEAAAYLILAGTHIGFLPEHYATSWIDAGLMRAVLPTEFTRTSEIMLILSSQTEDAAPGLGRFLEALGRADPSVSSIRPLRQVGGSRSPDR